jgi:hypothetical protein
MFRWLRPKRVYIVWETSVDPRASAAMEHVFYDRHECERHVAYAQAQWLEIDRGVQVYFTSHVVL